LYTWYEPENIARFWKPELFSDEDDDKTTKKKIPTPKPREKIQEHIMFLPLMGLRRLWYRACCGMCDRKRYWNTYMATLGKVNKDMVK
jgi:hypothetical protein